MSFPRYPAYKDSGVEWLGQVPDHWTTPPLYLRYEVVLGKMLDEKRLTRTHLLPYLRNVDVQWDRVNVSDLPQMDICPEEVERFTVRSGDLLVCEGGEVGRTALWKGHPERVAFQKAVHRLRPLSQSEHPKYQYYCMVFAASVGVFVAEGNPNTIHHLTGEKLRRYRFPTPLHDEQVSIAAFLDRETAKIDALIAEQQRLIDLLKEKRQAVISHAVTKGLNPDAPMKPSGVEWLGDVPAHWEIDWIKWSTIGCKNGIWGDEVKEDENDIPCVRVADFDRQRLRVELSEPTIRNVTQHERTGRVLSRGDLLLEKSGGGELQPVGCVVLFDDDGPAVCSNFVARVQLAPGMSSSFWRYLHAAAYAVRLNVRSIKQTSGIQNLDQQQYLDERAGFPPSEEQVQIAAFLDRETARIDGLMVEAQRAIDLLQERRTALISAAVTGQIDVRSLTEVQTP